MPTADSKLASLRSELQWERARRRALEGAMGAERAARGRLRLARLAVRRLRRQGSVSSEVARLLLAAFGAPGTCVPPELELAPQ